MVKLMLKLCKVASVSGLFVLPNLHCKDNVININLTFGQAVQQNLNLTNKLGAAII